MAQIYSVSRRPFRLDWGYRLRTQRVIASAVANERVDESVAFDLADLVSVRFGISRNRRP